MPMDRSKYPSDWEVISARIRYDRAKDRCECTGECGFDHAEESNGWAPDPERCIAYNNAPHPVTRSRVVLTVAHLGVPYPDGRPGDKHDKFDVRPENLKAMCQRCHLSFDMEDHVRNRAANRRQSQVDAGQMEIDFEESEE